jgi:hypothetical protein
MSTVDSLDIAGLTDAIKLALVADQDIGGTGTLVERSEPEPEEVPAYGWVGIFKESQDFPIITVGAGQAGRTHQIRLVVAVKHGDLSSGEQCEDNLEALLKSVRDALLNGGSFGGLVDFLSEMRVQYARYERSDTKFTQTAYMFVTFERRI